MSASTPPLRPTRTRRWPPSWRRSPRASTRPPSHRCRCGKSDWNSATSSRVISFGLIIWQSDLNPGQADWRRRCYLCAVSSHLFVCCPVQSLINWMKDIFGTLPAWVWMLLVEWCCLNVELARIKTPMVQSAHHHLACLCKTSAV